MEPAIVLQNISKSFKLKKSETKLGSFRSHKYLNNRLVALEEISFQVLKGEMIAIIGTNGSGKTSLLRIISGILKPDSGTIRVNGRIAPLLQIGTGFHNELTAKENIIIAGMLLGIPRNEIKKRVNQIIEFAELQEFADMKLKQYSSGMKARLAFSTALQVDPDILLVDEILSVGDITFRQKSYGSFLTFKEKGKTIVYATHNLSDLPKICDRVLLMHNGKMIAIGNPSELILKYKNMTKPQTDFQQIKYDIPSSQELKVDSEPIPIDPTKIYEWKIKIRVEKIGESSAYFGIIFTQKGKEVERKIQFITSTNEEEHAIITSVPSSADHAKLVYRVNCAGAKPSHTIIEFPSMENCILRIIDS